MILDVSDHRDSLNLDEGSSRQSGHLISSPCRLIRCEVFLVNFIDLVKVRHVLKENGAFDHIVEATASSPCLRKIEWLSTYPGVSLFVSLLRVIFTYFKTSPMFLRACLASAFTPPFTISIVVGSKPICPDRYTCMSRIVGIRERPHMMLASEGGGGSWKSGGRSSKEGFHEGHEQALKKVIGALSCNNMKLIKLTPWYP